MSGSGAQENPVLYLFPIYNSVQCMVGIFSFTSMVLPILITAVSNILYVAVGVWLLTELFRSEKIIYSA